MIYKLFTGKYIDLSRIITISDARLVGDHRTGYVYVGFEIECQLSEIKICHSEIVSDVYYRYKSGRPELLMTNGTYINKVILMKNECDSEVMAVIYLQKKIDEVLRYGKSLNQKIRNYEDG